MCAKRVIEAHLTARPEVVVVHDTVSLEYILYICMYIRAYYIVVYRAISSVFSPEASLHQ